MTSSTDTDLVARLLEAYTDEHNEHLPEWVRAQGIVDQLISDRARVDENEQILVAISNALRNPGRNPQHHRDTMERHKREWPVLWRLLERIRSTR